MLARLGDRVSAWFRATAPDPFVLAILLTVIAGAAATWAHWSSAESALSVGGAAWATLGNWQAGIWSLLAFGMEMCLILVTGHALAASPFIARALRALADLARTPRQGVALTAACAMAAALINWGFGLIVGAILARNVIAALRNRGVDAPAGLIAGAGYLGLMVWHGGLSGSAPLAAASRARQLEVLGADLGSVVGAIPVTETLRSPLNLMVTGGLVVIALAIMTAMAPKSRTSHASTSGSAQPSAITPAPESQSEGRFPRWLERSPIVVWCVALPALGMVTHAFYVRGLAALDLGLMNLMMLGLGLIAHGSARSYCAAIEDAARGCAGIIIQFPLYAGIMGMVQSSGLCAMLSESVVRTAGENQGLLGVLAVMSACIINLFVPTGGGQWAVQGPIFIDAALAAGVPPQRMIMAIAYGDELTNMLQPFWALPLLVITKVPAREIVGYTAIVMVAAICWTCVCIYFSF